MKILNFIFYVILIGMIMLLNVAFSDENEKSEFPDTLVLLKKIKIDPAIFVTEGEAQKSIKSKNPPFLIDVRSRTDFEKIRIPGSLNLPLYSIKTKIILKTRPAILFNEGCNNSLLMKECRKLNDLGFKAKIMYGGLNSWRKNKGGLEGDFFAGKKINRMSAGILNQEKDYTNWILIDVSEIRDPDGSNLLPGSIHIPFKTDQKLFSKQIRTTAHPNNPFSSILIFNEKGKDYEKIENSLSDIQNIFFLENGLNGYREFLRKQVLIWNKDKKAKIAVKKCASCP
ncbi:MAG: rhodanese-like domain-containing protein [Desulfobacterales bacterium]|nr:rhodanese-like domain-containing protein [Desulfobacterales bacterium]